MRSTCEVWAARVWTVQVWIECVWMRRCGVEFVPSLRMRSDRKDHEGKQGRERVGEGREIAWASKGESTLGGKESARCAWETRGGEMGRNTYRTGQEDALVEGIVACLQVL
eukprot:40223-Chlamydomonas_euryale.AAC.1